MSRFIALLALMALVAVAADEQVVGRFGKDPAPSSMNIGCVTKHCSAKMAKALLSPTFRKVIGCENDCNPFFYNDTSVGKLAFQNCTTKCALTYETPAGDEFLACAMTNNCIEFLPIPVTCPKPTPGAKTSLASLKGEWWQQYGKNKLWDAYPCQHIHKMEEVNDEEFCKQTVGPNGPVQAPCWSYTYSYDLFTETGTRYFQQTWQLPGDVPEGEPIDIFYTYMGSTHNETWYLLDAVPDRYVILVDCSYMSGWTNVGSILWVRPNVVLTDAEMADIAKVYHERMDWNFPADFVTDVHGADNCVETPPAQEITYVHN